MKTQPEKRSDVWLQQRVEILWNLYFGDARKGWPIDAHFGQEARSTFGSIKGGHGVSRVTINGLFAHPEIPEFVVDSTIVHELAHYVHGYGSGLKKQHARPHHGGVIPKELQKRGLLDLTERAEAWRHEHWDEVYGKLTGVDSHLVQLRERAVRLQWDQFLKQPGMRTEADLRQMLDDASRQLGLREAPYSVEWHCATRRQEGLSYFFAGRKCIAVHGLLAHPKAPDEIVLFQLAYWAGTLIAGRNWARLKLVLEDAGFGPQMEKALAWQRSQWGPMLLSHPVK